MKRSEVRTYIPKSEKKFFMEVRRRNCSLRSLKRIAQNNKNNLSITINIFLLPLEYKLFEVVTHQIT